VDFDGVLRLRRTARYTMLEPVTAAAARRRGRMAPGRRAFILRFLCTGSRGRAGLYAFLRRPTALEPLNARDAAAIAVRKVGPAHLPSYFPCGRTTAPKGKVICCHQDSPQILLRVGMLAPSRRRAFAVALPQAYWECGMVGQ